MSQISELDDDRDEVGERSEVAERFAEWSNSAGTTSPLYAKLAAVVVYDEVLQNLVLRLPNARRYPLYLLAAVHFLLLKGVDHRLKYSYSIVALDDKNHDPVAEFRSFCHEHADAIVEIATQHSVQTNEVNRCTGILPGLAAVHDETGLPLSLIDVGCSAGLTLMFDQFSYRLGDLGAGDPSSSVHLLAEFKGSKVPDLTLEIPPVARRIGIDLAPIDIHDDDAVLWLQACVWPDVADRMERLRGALELARAEPPGVNLEIHKGDLFDEIETAIDSAPAGSAVVVIASSVLLWLKADDRVRLFGLLETLSLYRPLWFLAIDMLDMMPLFDFPEPETSIPFVQAIVLQRCVGGTSDAHLLAFSHPHGAQLEWRDEGLSLKSSH